MKTIILSNGGTTTVDDDVYELAKDSVWRKELGYAVSFSSGKRIRLHRLVIAPKKNQFVDHKNGDRLDNRRDNLRICSNAQNSYNQKKHSNNKVGLKGVTRVKMGPNPFQATINLNGKTIYLGIYPTPELAHKAYCEAAVRLHGEFARFD